MKLIFEKWKSYRKNYKDAQGKDREAVVKKINGAEEESLHLSKDKIDATDRTRHTDTDEKIEEMNAMASGAVAGGVSNEREELEELLSTSTLKGGLKINVSLADREHAGHVARSKHQGLRNVMEDDDDTQPTQGETDDSECEGEWVKWKLQDFADSSRNASRVFSVLEDIESNIGLEKLKNAALADLTAPSRIKVMSTKFGYDSNLLERMKNGDVEAVKKYYQFVINEFLFWIAYNPMSSAMQYAMRCSMLSKPTRNLAFGLISNYVLNPNKYNPKAKGKGMASQADFYKLDKDLEPVLYELPE